MGEGLHVIKDKEGYYNYAKDPEYSATKNRLFGFLKKGYPSIKRGSR